MMRCIAMAMYSFQEQITLPSFQEHPCDGDIWMIALIC